MLWIPNLLRQLVISNVSVRCMYSLLTLQLWIFLALLSLGCNGRWCLLHFSSPLAAERLGVGHETEILKCCGLINVTTLSSLGSILLFRIVCQTGEELRWWRRALRGHLVWNKPIRGTLFFFFFASLLSLCENLLTQTTAKPQAALTKTITLSDINTNLSVFRNESGGAGGRPWLSGDSEWWFSCLDVLPSGLPGGFIRRFQKCLRSLWYNRCCATHWLCQQLRDEIRLPCWQLPDDLFGIRPVFIWYYIPGFLLPFSQWLLC